MALNLTNKTTFIGEINAHKIALENGKLVIASLFQGAQKSTRNPSLRASALREAWQSILQKAVAFATKV